MEIVENQGVLLRSLGRTEEAIQVLLEAHRLDPVRSNVCDALAHSYGSVGNREEMLKFGRRSLELKDEQASSLPLLRDLSGTTPDPYREDSGKKHVISFSLWGNQPRYLHGAIRNVQAAYDIYPGWICRFYCDDSVPGYFREHLLRHGAEIVMKPRPGTFFDGLLWRFEVIDDKSVDRFLVRDCDSVVTVQERVAVDEWLYSDKWFHVMRDFHSHTEVILAGMWGGVPGALPSLSQLRGSFRPGTAPTRTFDQVFLRECVWPIARQSVLIHDSVYTGCLGSRPFPKLGRLPSPFHVGQNEAAVRRDVTIDLPEPKPGDRHPVILVAGLDRDSVDWVVSAVAEWPGISVLNRGSLSGMLSGTGKMLEAFADGTSRDKTTTIPTDPAKLETVGAILGGLCGVAQLTGNTTVIHDDSGNLEVSVALAETLNAKILNVIRDPRETAKLRTLEGEGGIFEWAAEWSSGIERIASTSRLRPGRVELVRFEDFAPKRAKATWERLGLFLEAECPGEWASLSESADLEDHATAEAGSVIEEKAGKWMQKLRYLESHPAS